MTTAEIVSLAGRIASKIRVRPSYYSREDVEQDAIVILLQQTYDPACDIPELPWRFRNCLGLLRDHLKSKIRFTGELQEGDGATHDVQPDARTDTRAALDAVGLDDQERAVLLAQYEDGLTQQETATRLGICQQRVHQVRTAALEKLRGYFSENDLRAGAVQPTHG